ncbi:hypothetical protein CMI47_11565 [Candidatus Pacearchaeota archaeon]|jgi:hypothetical protein|nr:hypothetical protein [Candidatus Pacearchaeota archaeon]|tara:strand:+ start:23715 stop:25100 length:1386 start_codon:yes stop_codon:yes gene_type:complete
MSVPVFKIRLIKNTLPRVVGASIYISEVNEEKELKIDVFYEVSGGFYESENLYSITLSNRTIGSLFSLLDANGHLEAIYIGGPQDAPASFLFEGSTYLTVTDNPGHLSWYEFFVDETVLSLSGSSVLNSNKLSFFLTSIDPSSELNTTQRSFGKYINSREVYDGSLLTSSTSLYDMNMSVEDLSDLNDINYVQVNSEIMKVSSYEDSFLRLDSREMFDTTNQFHASKDVVKFLDINRVFNSSFGEGSDGSHDQFRCFAVVNTSGLSISDVSISATGWNSVKKSSFNIFVEVPAVESFSIHISTGGFDYFTVNSIDESVLNVPLTDSGGVSPFAGQLVSFSGGENDGQQRVITDYSISLNKFFINEDLPYPIQSGDEILFHTSPSSTSYTGLVDPRLRGSGRYSEEINLSSEEEIKISTLERAHGADMLSGDVIYLWIKRTLGKSSGVSEEMPQIDFLYGAT